ASRLRVPLGLGLVAVGRVAAALALPVGQSLYPLADLRISILKLPDVSRSRVRREKKHRHHARGADGGERIVLCHHHNFELAISGPSRRTSGRRPKIVLPEHQLAEELI